MFSITLIVMVEKNKTNHKQKFIKGKKCEALGNQIWCKLIEVSEVNIMYMLNITFHLHSTLRHYCITSELFWLLA